MTEEECLNVYNNGQTLSCAGVKFSLQEGVLLIVQAQSFYWNKLAYLDSITHRLINTLPWYIKFSEYIVIYLTF